MVKDITGESLQRCGGAPHCPRSHPGGNCPSGRPAKDANFIIRVHAYESGMYHALVPFMLCARVPGGGNVHNVSSKTLCTFQSSFSKNMYTAASQVPKGRPAKDADNMPKNGRRDIQESIGTRFSGRETSIETPPMNESSLILAIL